MHRKRRIGDSLGHNTVVSNVSGHLIFTYFTCLPSLSRFHTEVLKLNEDIGQHCFSKEWSDIDEAHLWILRVDIESRLVKQYLSDYFKDKLFKYIELFKLVVLQHRDLSRE